MRRTLPDFCMGPLPAPRAPAMRLDVTSRGATIGAAPTLGHAERPSDAAPDAVRRSGIMPTARASEQREASAPVACRAPAAPPSLRVQTARADTPKRKLPPELAQLIERELGGAEPLLPAAFGGPRASRIYATTEQVDMQLVLAELMAAHRDGRPPRDPRPPRDAPHLLATRTLPYRTTWLLFVVAIVVGATAALFLPQPDAAPASRRALPPALPNAPSP